MKIMHIIWDLEEGNSDYELPKEIDVPDALVKKGCSTDEILDWASDEYGYCICSCDIG